MVKIGALMAVVVIVATVACIELPGSNTTVITNTNTNNQGNQPSPGASPSPGAGGSCPGASLIAKVRVNPFGMECPEGTPKPNNSSGLLPVGCTAAVTATPKDQFGTDVPAELHGPDITWRIVSGSQYIQVTPDPNQDFNRNVTGLSAPGEFILEATVCGKAGAWEGRTVPAGQAQ